MARIVTFRVFVSSNSELSNIVGFVPGRDSVFVRQLWAAGAPFELKDRAGSGIYTGELVLTQEEGAEISFRYSAVVGGQEAVESLTRSAIVGPDEVATFISSRPHIFGTLDPTPPQGVRTGEKALFLPVSSELPQACHGWFFQNFVAWDGNAPIQRAGILHSRIPFEGDNDAECGPSGQAAYAEIDGIQALNPEVYLKPGEFQARLPYEDTGGVVDGWANVELFYSGLIFWRAFVENEAGITVGELQRGEVPVSPGRIWSEADEAFSVVEASTPMEKAALLTWKPAYDVGNLEWSIYRVEKSGYEIVARIKDSDLEQFNGVRTYSDKTARPGQEYLYLVGSLDWAFRASRVTISEWVKPTMPDFSAESQTPYSVTFIFG